jgi:hypothetical protein
VTDDEYGASVIEIQIRLVIQITDRAAPVLLKLWRTFQLKLQNNRALRIDVNVPFTKRYTGLYQTADINHNASLTGLR